MIIFSIQKTKKYWRMSKCHNHHHLKEKKMKSDCRKYCVIMFLLMVSGKILARFLYNCFPCYIISYVLPDAHAVSSELVMCICSVIEYLVSSKKKIQTNKCRQHTVKSNQYFAQTQLRAWKFYCPRDFIDVLNLFLAIVVLAGGYASRLKST